MKPFLSLLILAGAVPALAAAEIKIVAEPDRAQALLNEPFGFVITVNGVDGNIPSPVTPQVPGLEFQATGRAHNVNVVNGEMTSSVSFNYAVIPRVAGKITIPPVSITIEGREYKSAPAGIEVSQVSPESGSREIPQAFVSAQVDNTRPYVGQQVIYIFKLYSRTRFLSQPNLAPPDFAGFIAEGLPVRQVNATHDGVVYRVSEVRYALFPASPGQIEIGPAVLRVQIPESDDNSPFGRFFQTGRGIILSSNPVKLEVMPLPLAGKPAVFSGAVGSYRIESSVDHSEVKAGEPVTLSVIISGLGMVKSLPEPDWPEIPNARRYETVSSVTAEPAGDKVGGGKVFKMVLIPQSSGRIRIPPICMTVFNPQTKRYDVLRSQPLNISVKAAPPGAFRSAHDGGSLDGLKQMERDIRFLKPELGRAEAVSPMPGRGLIYRQIPPLLFVLAALFVNIVRRRAIVDPFGARARSASGNARRRLKSALKHARHGDSLGTYVALHEALANYLADIWGISAAGLTLNEACSRLADRGKDEETIRRVRNLWEQADLIRYAPAGASDSDLARHVKEAGDLIRLLERAQ